jgi:hypothetical protein
MDCFAIMNKAVLFGNICFHFSWVNNFRMELLSHSVGIYLVLWKTVRSFASSIF